MANSAFSDATHAANRHSDIAITSVASNDILKFDGTNWVNSTTSPDSSIAVTQSSHGFAVGEALKSSGSNGAYAKAQADSAANAEVVGIVTVVTDSNNFTLTLNGMIRIAGAVPNETAGTALFLSAGTAGALTATEPSTSGQISKPVAIVTTANTEMILVVYRGETISTGVTNWDVNGLELVLDADGDTTLHASTDDQIDVKISGADDFRFTANSFNILSGSTITIDSGATITNSGTANGFGGGSITALSGNAENRIPAFGSTTTALDGDADFTWDGNKLLVGNGTASTKITKGASFDMDGNADTVMEWRSTGRITHGMTGILDTNTFGAVQFVSGANSPNAGGLMLIGVSHANAGDKSGIGLTAVMRSGEGDNSHTLGQAGSPSGALLIQARQVSGTSWAALDAEENMIVVRNHTTTKYILDADGNTYQTGNVVIGTAGKGIDFSATSDEIGAGSMSNELFDDYEEGTFTAILKDSSGNVATQSQNSGRYTKIGNQVFIHIRLQVTSISGMVSGNSARIDGMPFAASSEAELVGGTFCWYASSLNMTNGGKYISANPEPSDTYMHMREWGENQEGVSTALTVGEISADGHILMSGIIRT